uniref:hypothetical protein n=1 Tax=Leptospira interrogans TaxID=173 RepID=UPI000772E78F
MTSILMTFIFIPFLVYGCSKMLERNHIMSNYFSFDILQFSLVTNTSILFLLYTERIYDENLFSFIIVSILISLFIGIGYSAKFVRKIQAYVLFKFFKTVQLKTKGKIFGYGPKTSTKNIIGIKFLGYLLTNLVLMNCVFILYKYLMLKILG